MERLKYLEERLSLIEGKDYVWMNLAQLYSEGNLDLHIILFMFIYIYYHYINFLVHLSSPGPVVPTEWQI